MLARFGYSASRGNIMLKPTCAYAYHPSQKKKGLPRIYVAQHGYMIR